MTDRTEAQEDRITAVLPMLGGLRGAAQGVHQLAEDGLLDAADLRLSVEEHAELNDTVRALQLAVADLEALLRRVGVEVASRPRRRGVADEANAGRTGATDGR